MDGQRVADDLGVAHSWGSGPEVVFLSSPLANPVSWSSHVRSELLDLGYRVTTFEHRPQEMGWRNAVASVEAFLTRRREPVALVGWSQGAAIAQEVALAAEEHVRCAALLGTYGRQNELDRILQEAWQRLAVDGDDAASVRLALGLLTSFPAERLADDAFVRRMETIQADFAGAPAHQDRARAATFISTYQDRLPFLEHMAVPCLVMGFELDVDTCAVRAREVARAIPNAEYCEIPGLAHAAPVSDPGRVWPPVVGFLRRHHPAPG